MVRNKTTICAVSAASSVAQDVELPASCLCPKSPQNHSATNCAVPCAWLEDHLDLLPYKSLKNPGKLYPNNYGLPRLQPLQNHSSYQLSNSTQPRPTFGRWPTPGRCANPWKVWPMLATSLWGHRCHGDDLLAEVVDVCNTIFKMFK